MNKSPSDKLDQLNVILGVIGSPDQEAINAMHVTADVRAYLQQLKPTPPANLREKYPLASDAALDLLTRMLQFSPDRRIEISVALQHPYFAGFPAPPVCPSATQAMLRCPLLPTD